MATNDEYTVLIKRTESYDDCEGALDEVFNFFDITPNDLCAAIKPNLVLSATPRQAVTTHPRILGGVLERASEKFGSVVIAEGSGSISRGETSSVFTSSGYEEVISGNYPLWDLNKNPVPMRSESKFLRGLNVGSKIHDADVIINLPKLKTHSQMILSAAVKNLHGCIVTDHKKIPHARFKDRMDFGRYLVDLCEYISPKFNIVDGILGMDGEGPTTGHPVKLGIIVAGKNAFAVDYAISKVVGLEPDRVPLLNAAMKKGVLEADEVKIIGDDLPSDIRFEPPSTYEESLGLASKLMPNRINELIFQKRRKPMLKPSRCVKCGECARNCPTNAIQMSGYPVHNYGKCIRCWCCIEFCPEGAIRVYDSASVFLPSFDYPAAKDVHEILNNDDVDAVILATPNHVHKEMIIEFARAKKHVFVEKPIANTVEDAIQITRACNEANIILSVGHDKRRLSHIREIKRLIDQDMLGKVVMTIATISQIKGVSISPGAWRFSRKMNPGGPLLQSGIHHADTLIYLLGRPVKVSAFFKRLVTGAEFDDVTETMIEFESGALGFIGASYASQDHMRIDIYGTRANLHYEAELDGTNGSLMLEKNGVSEHIKVPWVDPVASELEEFSYCVKTGTRPEVSGEEATQALAIVEAAIKSSEEGRPVLLQEVLG